MPEKRAARTKRAATHILLATAMATTVAASGLPAWAASQNSETPAASQKGVTETVSVRGGWKSSEMARVAEDSGRLLLHRIDAAADMIEAGDYSGAYKELDGAQDTAGAIKEMMPFVVVVDQIKDAKNKLIAEGAEYLRDTLLPVYGQLDEMAIYAPDVAQKAKQQVADAEQKANAGKTKEAATRLDSAIETITATTIYLPVDYVYSQVAAARTALSGPAPDSKAATHAIANAEASLVAVVTTAEGEVQGRAVR